MKKGHKKHFYGTIFVRWPFVISFSGNNKGKRTRKKRKKKKKKRKKKKKKIERDKLSYFTWFLAQ